MRRISVSFAEKYPDRLIDVGIAEEHAATMAAGLAACGETGGTTDSGTEAESTVAESSTAAESAEESQTDSAESEGSTADEYSAESSETAQSNAYQMVSFSSEHEPFGIRPAPD